MRFGLDNTPNKKILLIFFLIVLFQSGLWNNKDEFTRNLVNLKLLNVVELKQYYTISGNCLQQYQGLDTETSFYSPALQDIETHFRTLLKNNVRNIHMYRNYAMLLLIENKREIAEQYFDYSIDQGDKLSALIFGFSLASDRRWAESAKAILMAYPNAIETIVNQGQNLYSIGESSDALQCFELAVNIAPLDYRPYIWKGRLLESAGKYQEALETLNIAVELCPECGLGYLYRGFTLLNGGLGTMMDVENDFIKARQLDPGNKEIELHWAYWLQNKGDVEQAIAQYEDIIELYPTWDMPYIALANLYRKQNRDSDAELVLERAIISIPENTEINILMSEIKGTKK